ncbi:hypothetical protein D3C73_978590 [compost metagenome]
MLVLGILTYIAYKILETYDVSGSRYVQMLAGVLVMAGALWMLYPILFAKKDNDGNAEIITDPTVEIPEDEEEDKPVKE